TVARLVRRANQATRQPVLVSDGSYLVTGGLGGLGLRVARWLAERGARHIVLAGRRGLPPRTEWDAQPAGSEAARRVAGVQAVEALGARVHAVPVDVADEREVAALASRFGGEWPPLRGVVHAAVQMSACPLESMSEDAFAGMFAAKVSGARLLARAAPPLDFFVLFSSTTAQLGVSGLGHYAAANAVLDAMAWDLRARGVAALSVNWGTWDEMRVASLEERRGFAQAGLMPMSVPRALDILGGLIDRGDIQATVASVDWGVLKPVYEAKRRRPVLQRLEGAAVSAPATPADARMASPAGDSRARVAATAPAKRRELIERMVRESAALVLGISSPDRVDAERGFFDMGMDSLMAVDFKGRLEKSTGEKLPASLTFNYPSVTALTGYLLDLVAPTAQAAEPEAAAPAAGERGDLSEDEIAARLMRRLETL
ncbi:MAG: SDR family NAD(P)-dependent oxidoreductase, partial [Acidobacteria bacterium]|nr:SDR family NAD(P)-dependent oxidoreductase [Acidobacteriota bacterium]